MSFTDREERPLDAEEEALYEVARDAAQHVLETGAATLDVTWMRISDGPWWPGFDLRPRNPDALALAISIGGGDWIDTTLNVDGHSLNFELWAKTFEGRLAQIRERILAAIEGRVELKLERKSWLLFSSWVLVATFFVGSGPDKTSRTPAPPREYRDLFPTQPGDEASGLLGPRRFAAYLA